MLGQKNLGKLQHTLLLQNFIFVVINSRRLLGLLYTYYLRGKKSLFLVFRTHLLIASIRNWSHSKRETENLGICCSFCGMKVYILFKFYNIGKKLLLFIFVALLNVTVRMDGTMKRP